MKTKEDYVMFQPDYRRFTEVMHNRRPARLPLYEHIISVKTMESILDCSFGDLEQKSERDIEEFFRHYCRFFREMTYDTVSYEVAVSEILPGPVALTGGNGPIQTREDFDSYPWQELPELYWERARPRFKALSVRTSLTK